MGSNVLPAPTPILAKRAMQRRLGRIGRAELQDEIQDVEEVERGAFSFGRQRL